jgi:photosystem II stability/assembly factor-like uncharacterized protein
VDALTGYAVGGNYLDGSIIKTTDGGETWITQYLGRTNNFQAVQFPVDALTGYAGGYNGIILKTTNGGTNWVQLTIGILSDVYSIHFPRDAQTGYVGSDIIWKTTNGGTTWDSLNPGTNPWFFSVHFQPDVQIGYAVGIIGNIVKTTDGGATWVEQPSHTSTSGTLIDLRSVQFPLNPQTGYVVGQFGTILKTTDGGASFVEQNTGQGPTDKDQGIRAYPNPFSEQTFMRYQLSALGPVKLVIYNIAGQAVRTLENASRAKALSYHAVWDGRDERGRRVPAGVYLIRLEAGEHKETGRVVLIR